MRRLALLLLLLLPAAPVAADSATCHRLSRLARPALESFTEFNKTHAGSLFVMLDKGSPVGTGFLIDAETGLVLTAGHVLFDILTSDGKAVRNALAGKDSEETRKTLFERVSAWQTSKLDVELKFDAVAVHPSRDVAVLRLAPESLKLALPSQPFELGFSANRLAGSPLFGFPRVADVTAHLKRRHDIAPEDSAQIRLLLESYQPAWQDGPAEVMGIAQYKVLKSVIDGDSGGPVTFLTDTGFFMPSRASLNDSI